MSLDNILNNPALAGMRAVPQWVVYALVPSEKRPGKTDKIPLHYSTASRAGVNNPASWTDCATAAASARAWGAGFGIGFCFTESCGYWFVDLDSCLVEGVWSPLALQAFEIFPGAAVEISSSGKGLHFFGRGAIPPHASKHIALNAELYHTDRFVAMSGISLQGDCNTDHTAALAWFAQTYFPPRAVASVAAPAEGPRADWNGPKDDDELIRRAFKSKSAASSFGGKASFADLWDARDEVLSKSYPPDATSSEPYDRSSADAALAAHLAFWTGCDAARMERLMRKSKLAREKWDDRADYLVERTIGGACARQGEVIHEKEVVFDTPPAAPGVVGAPEPTVVDNPSFLNAEQATQLFKGCVYIQDQHRVLVPGGHLIKPDQFRARFGGYTFVMDKNNTRTTRNAWEALTESQLLRWPRADGTCFRPDLPYGTIVHDAGRSRANTYWPVNVPRKKGDVTRMLNHIRKLLPDDLEFHVCLYYMAAAVQRQGTKFQWAPVLQGVEGNGKTMLSVCIAMAIGNRYVHWPKASKLAKQFNAWMVGKTFYAVEDIHTSEHIDVIEELKPMITGGAGLEIEGKGVDQISAEICGNFFFNTNHRAGLHKTANDRRFCVLYSAQQEVGDLARDGMDGDYLPSLWGWLQKEDGFAIFAEYLWTLEIPEEFDPSKGCHRAPITRSTAQAIANSMGGIEQEVMEAIEQGQMGFRDGWVSGTFLKHLLEGSGRAVKMPPNKRRDMMRSLGYDWHPLLPLGRTDNAISPDGVRSVLYVKKGHAALALKTQAEVIKAYAAAQGTR